MYVNGQEAIFWPCGYNSFPANITPYLRASVPNKLTMSLENQPEASRGHPGAGLCRNVHLLVTQGAHVPVWGTWLALRKCALRARPTTFAS